ncbi:MAG: hypothetical protein H6742_16250 [Alphaproteobacteria bacterium]|nr:hypothetical protein [Alphaproteobacteria bacterium]
MALLSVLLLACAPQIASSDPIDDGSVDDTVDDDTATDDGGDDTTEEPDYSEYDGAWLEVSSPESGHFYAMDDDVPFQARVIGADGNELPFDDIVWTTDIDSGWGETGGDVDALLPVGFQAVTAIAQLPNGDRLGWTVGGILVQHEDAGTYVGDLAVDFTVDYSGTPLTTTCFGAATLYVDAYGETALGDSGCTVSLLGYDLDTTYDFDFTIEDQEVAGQAILDLVIFESQFEAIGELGGGELYATWENSLLGYIDFVGELDLTRISRDTAPE